MDDEIVTIKSNDENKIRVYNKDNIRIVNTVKKISYMDTLTGARLSINDYFNNLESKFKQKVE